MHLWDFGGAVDLRVHRPPPPPHQNSARRPQCFPVLPSLKRSFSLLKSETDSGAFFKLAFPKRVIDCRVNFSKKYPVLSTSQCFFFYPMRFSLKSDTLIVSKQPLFSITFPFLFQKYIAARDLLFLLEKRNFARTALCLGHPNPHFSLSLLI